MARSSVHIFALTVAISVLLAGFRCPGPMPHVTSGQSDSDLCMDCTMADCAIAMNACLDDDTCDGTDCTCCAAYWSNTSCTYDDLDADGAVIMDALSLCVCVEHCSTDCVHSCE